MIYCAFIGYLVGCINPTYLIDKRKGVDVKKQGSHNAGASNAMILFGRKLGAGVMLFDILKTALIMYAMGAFYSQLVYAKLVCGSACVLGHMFPYYMHFRGGKGFACLGGMILAFDYRLFLLLLVLTALVALLTDYVFIGALFAAVAFPLILGFIYQSWTSAACVLPASLGMLLRHKENFFRIGKGEELGFSWLWKKDAYIFPKDRKSEKSDEEDSGVSH